MLLSAVMDDLGAALATIDGLRVFAYWADRITPPAAVVGWPDPLTYDSTLRRGSDAITVPIMVMVGRADARSSRDQLAAYADGAGASSVKAAIEAHPATAYDSARVVRAEFDAVVISGVDYLAATFFVDLIGKGSA